MPTLMKTLTGQDFNSMWHLKEHGFHMDRNQINRNTDLLYWTCFHSLSFIFLKDLSHMFIAALFTIAKIWKQPKGPSMDEWIKKMWYIYTM